MTNPQLSVDVHLFDTEIVPPVWSYNGVLRMEFMEHDHSHPNAVKITFPGSGACRPLIVPMHELIAAISWLKQAQPTGGRA